MVYKYTYQLDENLKKKIVNSFVQNNGGFESIYFTPQFICTIGIFKHTNVGSTSDTILDIIKLEINYNCIVDAF